MPLDEQILSFVFSFIYGILISILYKISYKFLYLCDKKYSLINSLLFCIDLTLIYFKIFYYINNGKINIYFILITLVTFIIFKNKNLQKICKKNRT